MSAKLIAKDGKEKSVGTLHQDDVVQHKNARATGLHDDDSKITDSEIPPKKRKTRRGKCKRRNTHPYIKKDVKSNKVMKPEAPYNSNRFLIEDHGNIDEIDEELRNNDQISTSTVTRTRDSSFSVDSDGEFYSTPDDEEEFLIKDFDDQYESLQAERLQAMSKSELIQEYLLLETRLETSNKRPRSKSDNRKEIERLTIENEKLRLENELLKSKLSVSCSSDSADSETDSSDSCSTTSSSSMSKSTSPNYDYTQTNGYSPTVLKETV